MSSASDAVNLINNKLMMLTTILLILLAVGCSAKIVNSEEMAKISCYIIDDWTIFDLRKLESTTDYTVDNLTFNFCTYVHWPQGQLIREANTFAYLYNTTSNFALPITNGAFLPQSIDTLHDEYDNRWVSFTQESSMACEDGVNYSFTAEVLCDAS